MSNTIDLHGKVRDRDPDTSWNAAAQINTVSWSELQENILAILRDRGPSTDDEIFHEYMVRSLPRRTPQRLRTARQELTLAGAISESNVVGLSRYGNSSKRWEAS